MASALGGLGKGLLTAFGRFKDTRLQVWLPASTLAAECIFMMTITGCTKTIVGKLKDLDRVLRKMDRT